MSRQCNLVNNRPDGLETLWDESGKLMAEVNYKNGAVHGLYTLYSWDGKIIEQIEYENGKPKQKKNN
jgi:antitoxin component YwqK of YwqJK toxin-antitoxin module